MHMKQTVEKRSYQDRHYPLIARKELKIGTVAATLPADWRFRAIADTGWPG